HRSLAVVGTSEVRRSRPDCCPGTSRATAFLGVRPAAARPATLRFDVGNQPRGRSMPALLPIRHPDSEAPSSRLHSQQSLRQCSRAVQLSHSQFPATAVRLSHRPSRDSRNGWPQRVPTALESWENEMKLRLPLAAAAVAALGASAAFTVTAQATPNVRGPGARTASAVTASAPTGIHKIKHVIIILQE